MISAFGIDHGEISKAVGHKETLHISQIADRHSDSDLSTNKPGHVYGANWSATHGGKDATEEWSRRARSTSARRLGSYKTVSIPMGPAEAGHRPIAHGISTYRPLHTRKRVVGAVAAGTALAGAGAAEAVRRHRLSKSDTKRHAAEAGGAAVGAGLGQGAYQQAGYSTKHYVDRHTRKGGKGVTPDQIRMQDKALKANKKQFGMHLPNGSPGRNNVGYHRAYPSHLPYAKAIKTLGHTHEGRLGMGVGAAATVLGAAGGFGAVHAATRKPNAPRQ